MRKLIQNISQQGVLYENTYKNKKELISFNSLLFWTVILMLLNVGISGLQQLYHFVIVNAIAALFFSAIIFLNGKGYFRILRHVVVIAANIYVFAMSMGGGPGLQFEYAYAIILTMIGFVFIARKYLLIHFPITILFFIVTKMAYYYISPKQYIPGDQLNYYAFNNGVTFLILIAVNSMVFRGQTNIFLDEIETKKNEIEDKQKEIFDSITYAKRIQSALMANTNMLDLELEKEKYFIYFHPKDVVSGDFYWGDNVNAKYRIKEDNFEVNKFDELFYLAICDSTGHGVPGAFMSLLNMGFLTEAIKEKNIYEPNKIFDYVRKRLLESINNADQKDGFDGVLICFNKTTKQITYAAANNSVLLVSGQSLIHLPSDKMPVGRGEKTDGFKLHTFNHQPGDTIYVCTDGYADQFGGPKGKKFKYKQLEELLLRASTLSPSNQRDLIHTTFENWKGKLEQVDDVCIIGMSI